MNDRHTWHATDDELAAWREGTIGGPLAASIEAHLLHCHRCRLAVAADGPRQEAQWAAIADAIDRASLGNRAGPGWLRLAVGSPALRRITAALMVAMLVVPLAAAGFSSRAASVLLLSLAPLVPVAGVIAAYRPESDPAGTMVAATPLASARLVYVRTLVVLGAAVPVGLLTAAVLPGRFGLLTGWLLPGLALGAVVLAVGTRVDPVAVAVGLSAAWVAAVVTSGAQLRLRPPDVALEELFVNRPATQLACLAVAVVATAVAGARRHAVVAWSGG